MCVCVCILNFICCQLFFSEVLTALLLKFEKVLHILNIVLLFVKLTYVYL